MKPSGLGFPAAGLRTLGQDAPVAGQQRRSPRQRGAAAEQLARAQAGEGERARPGDAGAFAAVEDLQGEAERERAEQAGVDANRHRHEAPGTSRGLPVTRRRVAVAVRNAFW